MTPMVSAPRTVPRMVPVPPSSEVPPSTTAAMTCSSNPSAAFDEPEPRRAAMSSPANADVTPLRIKTEVRIRADGMPTRRAASVLAPTAVT